MTATDVAAAGAVATPLVVAVLGFALSRRLSQSAELLKVRLDYYRQLAPDLNTLMCFMTFIGTWRDTSPADIVVLKRRLDAAFFCAAPLYSPELFDAYKALMDRTFKTFNDWGADAKILTSAYRRRESWRGEWLAEWDDHFVLRDDSDISAATLGDHRRAYDKLLAAFVRDLSINRARERYTTDEVSLNAQAPTPRDVTGSG